MTDTTLDLKHNTDEEQPIPKLLNPHQEPASDCEDPPCANDCGNDDDCDDCEQKQSDAEDGCDETQECQDDHDPDTDHDQDHCRDDQEDKEDTDDEDDGEEDEEDEGDNQEPCVQDDEDPEHECDCPDPNDDKNNTDDEHSSSSSSEEDSTSEHCCSCADWSCECRRQRLCKHHQRPKRTAVIHVKQSSISEQQQAPADAPVSEQEEDEAQA